MYFRNPEQEIRKKNYARFEQMTSKGFSVAENTAAHQLYVVNEDPFGRAYYEKPLGQAVRRDPMTGQLYTVEEWATKEFVVDNKAQLINKASADLLLGKRLSVKWKEDDAPPGNEWEEWLADLVMRNRLLVTYYESALRNSSLGDQYFEGYIREGQVRFRNVNPYWVDIDYDGEDVQSYEIAWEIESGPEITRAGREVTLFSKRRKNEYARKKTHYPGLIVKELYLRKAREWKIVPYGELLENRPEVERALRAKHVQTYLTFDPDTGEGVDTDDPNRVMVIVEHTGIDEPLLIHWPNYRMFDVYGVSDTGMIESLQNALNNRETQLNDVMDKHTDPSMYGDASYLDEYGNLVMSGGGSRYFPVDAQGTPPGYLVWDSHLTECQDEIKRLYEAICANAEISPALLGKDEGGVESGRALMYKLIRSLAMRTRKEAYMKQAVADMVRIAMKLQTVWGDADEESPPNGVETPRTDWEGIIFEPNIEVQSSLPTDVQAVIEETSRLVVNSIISKRTALDIVEKYFDEIDIKQEEGRLADEKKEQAVSEQNRANEFLRGLE